MLNTILAPVFVFAIIVIVHEGGHFIMAKLTGMKVEEFAVGFGPKIFSKKRGETLYSLRCIPLGGYNKIAGMAPGENEDPRAFSNRPVWARLLVISAGSVFNILLAFFIFMSIFSINGLYTFKDEPVVGSVLENSSAYHAGIVKGDTIRTINGHKIIKWSDIGPCVSDRAGRVLTVEIESAGQMKKVTVIPQDNGEGRAVMGITPHMDRNNVSFIEAVRLSYDRCAFILAQIIGGLQQIFTGTSGDVAGPIGVARMAGTVAEAGITALFTFIALLSLNLGFLNLLPVPLLDGGLFLLTLLEAVYGKKLPEKSLYYIQALGVTVIAFLFLLAMFNDISSIFK